MRTLLLATLLVPLSAFAVKTERWEFNTTDSFLRGKLQNLSLSSDGELLPGYASQRLGEFGKQIWSSVVGRDGTIYFGTAGPADVQAVGKDGKVTKLFGTETIAVTALALDARDKLFAATLGDGKIFQRDGTLFCQVPAPYIWSLALDAQGNLFAGTGPDGKIFRVTAAGQVELWYQTEDSNILCLALDATGALLAGGSDRGQLYRITAKETGTVLHQFAEDEVHSLAVSGDQLYIGVNKQKVRRPRMPFLLPRRPPGGELEESFRSQPAADGPPEAGGRDRPVPLDMRMANLLAGALYVRNAEGRVDQWASWDKESVLDLKLGPAGSVWVAMSGHARVYRVVDSQRWELWFDFDEQQALTLAVRDGNLAFVGAGNVGTGYRIEPQPAPTGEYTSPVLDARFAAAWGNAAWVGTGPTTIATRSGNTSLPDATWSAWSAPGQATPHKVASPAGRYLQFRLQLAKATLTSCQIFYQVQNQKPSVTSIRLDADPKIIARRPSPKVADDKEGEDATGGDDKAESSARPVTAKKASPLKTITWQAADKDGDALVYRLFYRAASDEQWIAMPLEKPLKKNSYAWDTDSIPDGWYRLKVVASDEDANPAGQALSDEKISDLIKVDNRRPEIVNLRYDPATATLSGLARDNLSLLTNLEYSVDGGDWKPLASQDGIFDNREEPFRVTIEKLPAGPHSIAVRATDEDGNVGVEKLSVR